MEAVALDVDRGCIVLEGEVGTAEAAWSNGGGKPENLYSFPAMQ
jgi:hypothetical protein